MLQVHNAPISTIARMDKFTRGMALAASLKNQRTALALAKRAISAGALKCAKHYMSVWAKERQAYKLALSWQSL